jgi:demethylmenaquinone methyltransferase/2-methoxy-6-polyprenyl-1,4-benzoquinol methylase
MKDKTVYIQAMFTAIADKYDLLNSLLSFGQDAAWRRFAASRCSLPTDGLVLDVATGTAELARHLARRNDRGRIVGVDFCSDMLDKAKAKLSASGNDKRIHLVLGDALRLPFPDDSFDCATIGFALRNVSSIEATFGEMTRVVKPGGRVISLELTRPRSRLLKAIYYLYLLRIAPYIGGLISRKREAYTYLPDSILEFPSPEQVAKTMEGIGLESIEIHRLMFGVAAVHVGIKRTE